MTGVNVERARATYYVSLDQRCTDKTAVAELLVAAAIRPSTLEARRMLADLLLGGWLTERSDGRFSRGPSYANFEGACGRAARLNAKANASAAEPPLGSVVVFRRVPAAPWDSERQWTTWKRWPEGWTAAEKPRLAARYPMQWSSVLREHGDDYRLSFEVGGDYRRSFEVGDLWR